MKSDIQPSEAAHASQKLQKLIDHFESPALPLSYLNGEQKKIISSLKEIIAETDEMDNDLAVKEREIEQLHLNMGPKTHFGFLYSKNKEMQKLFMMAEKYKDRTTPIILTGESGCGKEALARMIHMRSGYAGPFVIYQASQTMDSLLQEDHATLYFGDVSLTTPEKQKTILAALTQTSKINIRLIISCAQINELEPEVVSKLKGIQLHVVSLRERKEDILPLMDFFIREFSKNERNISHFSASALNKLIDYPWPGNISELKLELKQILMEHNGKKLFTLDVLSEKIVGATLKELFTIIKSHKSLPQALETLEKKMVLEALIKHNWNKSKVSRELGISRSGLIQKVQKYSIAPAVYFSKFSETKRRITSRNSGLISVN